MERPPKNVPDAWGYYYLRYFVGAIVGAGLLVALWTTNRNVLPSFPHGFPLENYAGLDLAAAIAALGTAGLAYCYIASAPILLLHGLRFRLHRMERGWSVLRSAPLIAVVLLGLFVWRCGRTPPSQLLSENWGRWLLRTPYVIAVVVEIGLLWGAIDGVRDFYRHLASQRAGPERWVNEYVESYRHLREHGNAFLIIVLEVILAAALYVSNTTVLFFTVAVIWVVPATFSWFLGTWLEFEIVVGRPNADAAKDSVPESGNAILRPRRSWIPFLALRWRIWGSAAIWMRARSRGALNDPGRDEAG